MKPSRFFPLLLPPLLTASLLLALYAFGGLFPFGTKTLVWCDMKQQVVPLMMQLKELLTGNGSLLYSPLSAGGMNFWGVFFFFLASPFSFLCLLTPREDFLFLMNLLVLLKLSLSALTAAVYFRKRYPGLGSLGIPLSVMYALCGYGMLFYQNLIWLDMMALFPLLLLSCRTLAKEGRVLPYTLALTAAMVLNYYIGYMVVLFLILCFGIALLLSPKERRGRLAAGFLLGSALAALLSAAVWLPSLLQYASSGRGRDIIAGLKGSRLLAYLHTTLSLLLGTAFVLPALFLLRKRGAGRELALQGVLLALLTLPLILEPVNKMWHTGSYMSFPARYGFMTVFLALSLTGGLLELTEEARKEGRSHPAALLLGGVCGCGLLVFGIRYYASNTETLSRYVRTLWGSNASFWGLMIFFGLALVLYELLLILREKQLLGRRGLCLLLTLTALAEGSFSGQVYMLSARDKTDTVLWQQAADLGGRIGDDGFYRVKAEKKDFDVNLLGGMGYPTFAHYTSLTSETT
ncbi:MAG: YfhO family protein, partial [Oscillospiraceae bacterium]|nr:YfhO family protein [Oscillospiraceae bacterium]